MGWRPELADEGPDHGLSAAEVELRSELASYIGRAYPLDREALLSLLADRAAPEQIVELVAALDEGREFENLQDLWEQMGGKREDSAGA